MKKIFTVSMIMLITSVAFSQGTGIIKGKIITADNQPAEGVSITLKNTAKQTIADNSEVFEIKNVPVGEYTVLITLIGHKDAEQQVSVEANKATDVTIQLLISNNELNEVVVLANRNSFKTNRVSGSLRLGTPILEIPQNIQVVTAKQINNQQIFDMLEGVTRNVSSAIS